MKISFTEQDIVFKGETLNEVISYYLDSLDEESREGVRSDLTRLLKKAEKEKRAAYSETHNLEGFFDAPTHIYLLIRRGAYNAANLLYNLFDILVEHPQGEPEELEARAFLDIDRYIGEIEGREGINLLGQRENLKQICREMIHTLCLIDEEEFPDRELEKLSDTIDRNYYEPMALILQEILIQIEKPR